MTDHNVNASGNNIGLAIGQFPSLLGIGLTQVFRACSDFVLLGTGLRESALEGLLYRRLAGVLVLDGERSSTLPLIMRLKARHTGAGVVAVMSEAPSPQLLAAGASCITQDATEAVVLTAARYAALTSLTNTARRPISARQLASLTRRESEVLQLLNEGRSYPEVATHLHIALETVRTHATHIRDKLDVKTKQELIGILSRVA
jgi:DNA-binding CsgD family transcriptional regulator